jgi:hypothetical protein
MILPFMILAFPLSSSAGEGRGEEALYHQRL